MRANTLLISFADTRASSTLDCSIADRPDFEGGKSSGSIFDGSKLNSYKIDVLGLNVLMDAVGLLQCDDEDLQRVGPGKQTRMMKMTMKTKKMMMLMVSPSHIEIDRMPMGMCSQASRSPRPRTS